MKMKKKNKTKQINEAKEILEKALKNNNTQNTYNNNKSNKTYNNDNSKQSMQHRRDFSSLYPSPMSSPRAKSRETTALQMPPSSASHH